MQLVQEIVLIGAAVVVGVLSVRSAVVAAVGVIVNLKNKHTIIIHSGSSKWGEKNRFSRELLSPLTSLSCDVFALSRNTCSSAFSLKTSSASLVSSVPRVEA